MENNNKTGIVVGVSLVTLLLGVILGMLAVHIANKEKINDLNNQVISLETQLALKPEIKNVTEVTNFYYPKRQITAGHILKNSYDSEGFEIIDNYMTYTDVSGNKISHLGADMSYHQDKVDWDKIKNGPLEFVMLRCGYRGYTEGGLVVDEKFKSYAKACNERGINLGVYFFTQAITEEEAIEEADFVIDLLKDYKIQYPVALDTELVNDDDARTNKADLSKDDLSKICIAFCERIREAGYYPIIYASENWMRRRLNLEMLTDYDFWAAQYLEENDFLYDFTIWQYTEKGKIPGVSTEVDLNVSMVDYASFVPGLFKAVNGDGEVGEYDENIVELDHEDENLNADDEADNEEGISEEE